jgi:hypothetical protein
MAFMKNEKVAKEVAELEFERICAFARVDTDDSEWSDEEKSKWEELRSELVTLIRKGALVVSEDGAPMFAGLKFRAPTGAAIMAFETYAPDKKMSNLAAVMCELTGSDKGTFGKMHARDFNACSHITTLFLG